MPPPASATLIRFCALTVVWGVSFPLIKVATDSLPAVQVTFGRLVIGAATVLAMLWAARERLPRSPALWGHVTVVALFLNTGPFTLYGLAETRVTSTLAGICNATAPLYTVLFTLLALRSERPNGRRLTGLAVGFVGVLVVLGAWDGLGGQDLAGTGMALAAPACYGAGWVYLRRHLTGTSQSALSLAAAQLLAATVQSALLTVAFTGPPALDGGAVLAVVGLGVLSTGVAFALQVRLVRDAGATIASTVTYVVPIVSTLTGIAVLGERPRLTHLVGAGIIIAGAYLVRDPPSRQESPDDDAHTGRPDAGADPVPRGEAGT